MGFVVLTVNQAPYMWPCRLHVKVSLGEILNTKLLPLDLPPLCERAYEWLSLNNKYTPITGP